MFGNLHIGTRLGSGFAVVVGLFAVILLIVGMSLSQLTRDVSHINDESLPFVLVVEEMNLSRSEVQQFLTDVSATHDRKGYTEAEEAAKRFKSGAEKFRQMYQQENDLQSLKQIETIEADFNKFYASGKAMAEAYITKGFEAGNLLMQGSDTVSGFDKDSETISAALNKFREQQVAEANSITALTLSTAKTTMSTMVAGGLVAALLAAFFALWAVRSITKPMLQALKLARAVAEGDLSMKIEVKSTDEIGQLLQALKDMDNSLIGIVGSVRSSTESINTSSDELAQSDADLSQRTEEQASSLEETASSMEELTSTVRQNAENAKQASHLATTASDIAVRGGKVVDEVVHTMASISASSNKIVDIISVIEGIAFQTNILALNAAVEAARAGEQGRGFAVVAGEVRNLAQRSAAAAKEIKALIGDSVGKVEVGSKQVDQAGATMDEIVTAVKRVTDIMAEIAAASNEQSAGIDQVNQAIIQMDEVTQQNAAMVEEAAAAAEAMHRQAEMLMDAVSIFKLEAGTATAQMAAAKAAVSKPVTIRSHAPAAHHPSPHLIAHHAASVAANQAPTTIAYEHVTGHELANHAKKPNLHQKSAVKSKGDGETVWAEF